MAKKRQRPQQQDTPVDIPAYRVWKIGVALRESMGSKRAARGETVREFIEHAVRDELTPLVQSLHASGVHSPSGPVSSVRVPMSDLVLETLRKASQESGLDQSQLFAACLRNAITRRRRRSRK